MFSWQSGQVGTHLTKDASFLFTLECVCVSQSECVVLSRDADDVEHDTR